MLGKGGAGECAVRVMWWKGQKGVVQMVGADGGAERRLWREMPGLGTVLRWVCTAGEGSTGVVTLHEIKRLMCHLHCLVGRIFSLT